MLYLISLSADISELVIYSWPWDEACPSIATLGLWGMKGVCGLGEQCCGGFCVRHAMTLCGSWLERLEQLAASL
jgi:hypothetical protein